jgi:hypothetical protein
VLPAMLRQRVPGAFLQLTIDRRGALCSPSCPLPTLPQSGMPELSKLLSEEWKKVSDEDRAAYKAKAKVGGGKAGRLDDGMSAQQQVSLHPARLPASRLPLPVSFNPPRCPALLLPPLPCCRS